MLQDAKKNGNPTVTTWLDLQNACGTVPHNLIQFVLEWYHITEHIRKIVFNYYNQLFICVKTKEWTTNWIIVLYWCFPGLAHYQLSCILFLAVFNLCLDLSGGTIIFYSFIF